MYQIFKDFAGPVATIIAAFAAVSVTGYFACQQAVIARDKLEHDVFYRLYDRRVAVYELLVNFWRTCSTEISPRMIYRPMGCSPLMHSSFLTRNCTSTSKKFGNAWPHGGKLNGCPNLSHQAPREAPLRT